MLLQESTVAKDWLAYSLHGNGFVLSKTKGLTCDKKKILDSIVNFNKN